MRLTLNGVVSLARRSGQRCFGSGGAGPRTRRRRCCRLGVVPGGEMRCAAGRRAGLLTPCWDVVDCAVLDGCYMAFATFRGTCGVGGDVRFAAFTSCWQRCVVPTRSATPKLPVIVPASVVYVVLSR